jgi:hypothetical protein
MLKAAPLSWEVSQTLSLPMVLTHTSSTAETGRNEGCSVRYHAPRGAPVGRWSPMSARHFGTRLVC